MPRWTSFLFATGFFVVTALPGAATSAEPNDVLPDVAAALKAVKFPGDVLHFERGEIKLPAGGHLQGIQAIWDAANKRELLIISHDSLTVAYLAFVEVAARTDDVFTDAGRLLRIQQLPSDGQSPPLRHAGGIQLSGTTLAVGVEDNQDKRRSQIQFWNVADPDRLEQFKHLTILRSSDTPKQATAGAIGLVTREKDHLLAVGNWDCRAIDFYVSNGKPLADPTCRFEHVLIWKADSAATEDWKPDSFRGTYQSLNLLRETSGSIFLLGFDTTPAGQNVIDLYEVDLALKADRALRKVGRKTVSLDGDSQFRHAGGAIIRDGELLILSSERNFRSEALTRLNVLRSDSR